MNSYPTILAAVKKGYIFTNFFVAIGWEEARKVVARHRKTSRQKAILPLKPRVLHFFCESVGKIG